MQLREDQQINIWSLPQEIRDMIYEEALANTDAPGQLPSELYRVCHRIRQETRRLYKHGKIRSEVFWNYWKPLSYSTSDQNTILSYRQLHVRTPQNPSFASLRLDFIMSHAVTGHRRVSMVNLSLASETGEILPFRLRPRLDIVGPDLYAQSNYLVDVAIAKVLEGAGHRLSKTIDYQDARQRKMGTDLCCELDKSVRRLKSGWTTVILNQADV